MKKPEMSIRRPPGFMEYGSDLLTLERVKLMSLAERGLLATMRWYIWSNDSLPADPKMMARLLGLEPEELRAALTDRVLSFFEAMKGDPTRLVCPELAAQMTRLLWRRDRQAAGAELARISRKTKGDMPSAKQDAKHLAQHVAPELNRTELNRTELGSEADKSKPCARSSKENKIALVAEFVAGYEREQAKESSAPAQGGERGSDKSAAR
jgi:hypothetical protein